VKLGLKNRRGRSLLEVMVAMFILTVLAMGIAPLLVTIAYLNFNARAISRATAIAQEKLEEIKAKDPTEVTPGTFGPDSIDYFQMTTFITDTGTGLQENMFRIRVEVEWLNRKGEKKYVSLVTQKAK